MKKNGLFDVTMGAYDGAEVHELVETLLFDKIRVKYDKKQHRFISQQRVVSIQKLNLKKQKRAYKKNIQGIWFRNSGRI